MRVEVRTEIAKIDIIEIHFAYSIEEAYGFQGIRVSAEIFRAKIRSPDAIWIRNTEADGLFRGPVSFVLTGAVSLQPVGVSWLSGALTLSAIRSSPFPFSRSPSRLLAVQITGKCLLFPGHRDVELHEPSDGRCKMKRNPCIIRTGNRRVKYLPL